MTNSLMIQKNAILKTLTDKMSELGATDEDVKCITAYVETDKYRRKMLDFLEMAEGKGDIITPDQLNILALRLSHEEEKDRGM